MKDIDKYWSNFFGIDIAKINPNSILVVPHENLVGFNGAWIFRRRDTHIISVPDSMLERTHSKIHSLRPSENLISTNLVETLFGNRIARVIGPVYQGYYPNTQLHSSLSQNVRELPDDSNLWPLIEVLAKSGDPEGWRHSSTDRNCAGLFGYFHQERLVSIANYKIKAGNGAFIGVYTHPEWRGKGFSLETVKVLVQKLSQEGKLVMYQTLHANTASIKLASHLGFEEYACNFAVRFKSSQSD